MNNGVLCFFLYRFILDKGFLNNFLHNAPLNLRKVKNNEQIKQILFITKYFNW